MIVRDFMGISWVSISLRQYRSRLSNDSGIGRVGFDESLGENGSSGVVSGFREHTHGASECKLDVGWGDLAMCEVSSEFEVSCCVGLGRLGD
jgi:hypothetical protein